MKIKILSLCGCFLLLMSCKKQLDINRDPSLPAIELGTPQLLLPPAVMSTAGRVGGDMNILGGIWSEYFTQAAASNQYKTIDSYDLKNTDFNGAYNELYSGALNDYQTIIDKSTASSNWTYYLIATVMKAYTLQVLVDLYDQVPYSEAFQGNGNLQPKFDDGYSVYEDLLSKIDTALSKDLTARTNVAPGSTDLVFNGDMDQWIRFANTLKLKMYLRMVNTKPEEAQSEITALFNSGAEFLESDAAISSFSATPDKQNPFYAYNIFRLNTTTNLRISETLVSYLEDHSDPRIVSYAGTTSPLGMNQGDYTNNAFLTATVFVQSATDPVEFISGAESYLLQAEAKERYFNGGGAKTLYDAGVTAAFAFWGFDATSFIATGGDYAYPVTGTLDNKIEAIINQKWASFPGGCHSLEAFFERNRTGYPKSSSVYYNNPAYVPGQFVISANSVIGDKYPKRLVFPDVEKSRNSNTPAEVPITTPVWWAK